MITVMRRYRRVLQVGLLVVIAAFVATSVFVFGQSSLRGDLDTAVARVNGEPISSERYQRRYQEYLNAYAQTLRERFSPEMAERMGLPQQVMDDLVQEELVVQRARAENLEAGDVVAVRVPPRSDNYVASMRVHETVQDRLAKGTSRRPLSRLETVEGTVENVNHDRGVFDLRLRSGKVITVTLPYNARSADADDLRQLRRGDFVRLEGEFVNPETFQLQAFLSAPFRASR
jgi:hypothetical protein